MKETSARSRRSVCRCLAISSTEGRSSLIGPARHCRLIVKTRLLTRGFVTVLLQQAPRALCHCFCKNCRKLGCSDKKPRAALVKSITPDRYGIGYSAIGFKAEGVRAVPLASYYGGPCAMRLQ